MKTRWKAGVIVCLTTLAAACSDSRPTQVESQRALRPDSTMEADQASVTGAAATASITGSAPNFLAQVDASFIYTGSKGIFTIAPSLIKENKQALPLNPLTVLLNTGAYAALVQKHWQQTVNAQCGVEMVPPGYASLTAWMELGGVQVGNRVTDQTALIAQSAVPCQPPQISTDGVWVDFQQYGTGTADHYRAGNSVSTSFEARGYTGTIVDEYWSLDGGAPIHSFDVNVEITAGAHTIKFWAITSVGYEGRASFSYTGDSDQCDGSYYVDPSDPMYDPNAPTSNCSPGSSSSGGGGGSTPGCQEEYIYMDINYWDGTGWHEIWEGWALVCG